MIKKILMVLVIGLMLVLVFDDAIWQAALLLPDLVPGGQMRLLDKVTNAPVVSAVRIQTDNGSLAADLYTPADPEDVRGAFLLIPGASALGRKDPRITNFGTTLARVGVAVLIPDFPDITAERFATSSAEEIVSAYQYLSTAYPGEKHGMLAFSIASGPMFMAAADSRIAGSVDYLAAFGAYDDMKEVIRNAATGEGRDPTEAAEISAIFKNHFGPDPRFDALMANSDPAKFEALYAQLDPAVRGFIEGVSPAPYLPKIETPKVLLLHSDPDPDVPTAESYKLASLLGPKAELFILKSFSHTDVELKKLTPVTLFSFYNPEVWKLYRVAYKVLTF